MPKPREAAPPILTATNDNAPGALSVAVEAPPLTSPSLTPAELEILKPLIAMLASMGANDL